MVLGDALVLGWMLVLDLDQYAGLVRGVGYGAGHVLGQVFDGDMLLDLALNLDMVLGPTLVV